MAVELRRRNHGAVEVRRRNRGDGAGAAEPGRRSQVSRAKAMGSRAVELRQQSGEKGCIGGWSADVR